MRIAVDRDKCCAFGECVAVAPELFSLDQSAVAIALRDSVSERDEVLARNAAQVCPTQAIVLTTP